MELPTIGQRAAHARRVAELTQAQLADMIGVARETIARWESGTLPLDSMSTIAVIAEATHSSISRLLGLDTGGLDEERALYVRGLRSALQRSALGILPDAPPRPLGDLRVEVAAAHRNRFACEFDALGSELPELIDELRLAARHYVGPDGDIARVLLVEALHDARFALKKTGALDLAWMAAEQAQRVADDLGEPLLIAASRWNLAEVASSDGDPWGARAVMLSTLDGLEAELDGQPEAWSLAGMVHLKAAMMYAYDRNRHEADAHLGAAREAVRRVGGVDRNDYGTQFGPGNVHIHEVGIAVELGDDALVVARAAKGFRPASIPSRERQARYWLDIARAFERRSQWSKAADMLVKAESAGHAYVRQHPLAREITAALVRRARTQLPAAAARLAKAIPLD